MSQNKQVLETTSEQFDDGSPFYRDAHSTSSSKSRSRKDTRKGLMSLFAGIHHQRKTCGEEGNHWKNPESEQVLLL